MPNLTFAVPTKSRPFILSVKEIEAGATHCLAIQNDANSWGWGQNTNGGVGDNTVTDKFIPTSISGAKKTFCSVNAGNLYSLALQQNGRIWAWGLNGNGQLGDNSVVSKNTPISIGGANKTFCAIAAGFATSGAIDKNGRIWTWGSAGSGALGDNSVTNKSTPVSICGAVKTFCKIAAGGTGLGSVTFFIALDKNGRAWGWGTGISGSLGINSATNRSTPVSIVGAVKTFCQISSGIQYSLAIDKNGRLWAWGNNGNGSLGDNSVVSKLTPVSVLGAVKTFCKIAATIGGTTGSSYGIDKNGRIWAWGTNTSGALGNNSTTNRSTPVSVCGAVKTFCAITAGLTFAVAIDNYGDAWAWGLITNGRLGIQYNTSISTPKSIQGANKTFCTIAGTMGGSFVNYGSAIDKNGRLWTWGNNSTGQLGINSITSQITPVSVCGAVKTFCKISNGASTSAAIDKNGRVWMWGSAASGALGDNSVTSKRTPISICGAVKTFCQISVGADYAYALDKNGRIWAWGSATDGKIGDNSITNKSTPVSICGAVKTFCQIAINVNNSSAAIDKNGRVWMWGRNTAGMLGDNSIVNRSTPVSICGAVKTFCKISVGNEHTAAIDKNGRAWAWGNNGAGNLGDGTGVSKSTPVSVLGAVKTFCEISVGDACTLALDKNGMVWGWGYNTSGQLGNNSTTSRLTPVSVCGAVKTFCKISAAYNATYAIDKNGKVWSWGRNTSDQLGQGVITLTPVRVCVI